MFNNNNNKSNNKCLLFTVCSLYCLFIFFYYLYFFTDICAGVDSQQFSDGSSLSSYNWNDILLYLAASRSGQYFSCSFCHFYTLITFCVP